MSLTIEKINKLKEAMKLLPPLTHMSKINKSAAIKLMETEIRNLKKNGYTVKQISEFFEGQGFQIKSSTIISALRTEKRKKNRILKSEIVPTVE